MIANRHVFLSSTELMEASRLFDHGQAQNPLLLSEYLSSQVLKVFRAHPLWFAAHPILLGSWGRGELAPKSDLDLLFLGPEASVLKLTSDLLEIGYRISYRVPEDLHDWSQGVKSTDILALWQARAETVLGNEQLLQQQNVLFSQKKIIRKILSDLASERKARAQRFDSIQSFLEPQLKFGPGGLRDLFQGQVILDLFKERFQDLSSDFSILQKDKLFLLKLRQKMHLNGDSDILIATEQLELAAWLKMLPAELSKLVQQSLSRVHFYSQWILEMARLPEGAVRVRRGQAEKLRTPAQFFKALQADPCILTQYEVRKCLELSNAKKIPASTRGQLLRKLFSETTSDETLQAVFHSRLIEFLCPRMTHLIGRVQHDQYHRFTADAHLLQSCREVLKARKNKKSNPGPMNPWLRKLSKADWTILIWTALYHDLAKGMSGDHSGIGEKWVGEDLKSFGFPKSFIQEVQWMVRNHLELSTAAFRKNPQSPETWQDLQLLGINPNRLQRLGAWTLFDIKATNPEAWTDWKAKLLSDLMERVLDGATQNFLELKKSWMSLPAKKRSSSEWLDQLDPILFQSFAANHLLSDLEKALEQGQGWSYLKDRNKKLWVRYFQSEDKSGLLSEVVEKIYASGASIQHALVQTLPGFGVYDWFQVQTNKNPPQLLKWIESMKLSGQPPPAVAFLNIKIISSNVDEWVLSFKGLDQKGLLLAAVRKLKDLGVEVKSARVHTWGQQIEDLFSIAPPKQEIESFTFALKAGLATT